MGNKQYERQIEAWREDSNLDAMLSEVESRDELPASAEVEVGGLLRPWELRNAEIMTPIAINADAWLWSDGREIELRYVPQALERAARAQSREIARREREREHDAER